jgi:hypothetical protein
MTDTCVSTSLPYFPPSYHPSERPRARVTLAAVEWRTRRTAPMRRYSPSSPRVGKSDVRWIPPGVSFASFFALDEIFIRSNCVEIHA